MSGTDHNGRSLHAQHNYADGDIVLSSKDDALFRVHSTILKLASSFFRQMLEVPRAPGERADEPIPLEESERVIAAILHIIYPKETVPKIQTISFAWELSLVADKYDIPRVIEILHNVVLTMQNRRENYPSTDKESLEAYVLACRWKWDDVAELAAKDIIRHNNVRISDFTPQDLQRLSGEDLARVFRFHEKRIDVLLDAFRGAIGMDRLEEFYDYSVDEYWFCCDCGQRTLSMQQAYNSMLAIEDGIRGNLGHFQNASTLLDRWFSMRGPLKILLGCPDCDDEGTLESVILQMQAALETLDASVPWSSVSKIIFFPYLTSDNRAG